MRTASGWVLLVALGGLAACGSKGAGTSATGSAANGSRTAGQNAPGYNGNYNKPATAQEVADESRGDVECPARNKSAPRPSAVPVDDVVGVRPGMTYEEATNFVLCTDKLLVAQLATDRGVNMQTYGQKIRQGFSARIAEARVEKSSKQIMQEMQDDTFARGSNRVVRDMKPGQSKWYVGTMGLPDHERVITAAREEWFQEGHNPTAASVEQALVAKYGAPTKSQRNPGQTYLTWAYEPSGRPVAEGSPLFNQCAGTPDPNGGANYSPDCGLVIAARIASMPDNPDISQFIQVGVVDQAGGYRAITETEKGLANADEQRKAQQVQEAAKNADAPKL
ncbi:MAG: hypothetical protein ABI885_04580 [Gammaproteobacteria bacterium]